MSSYPKWLYHPTQAACVVSDEAAHKALGAGWVESPADVKRPVAPAQPLEALADVDHPAQRQAHNHLAEHPRKAK